MRRRLLGLLVAGLAAAPLAAAAGPSDTPTHRNHGASSAPHTQAFHWSFSSEKGRLGISVIGLTSELRQHFGAPVDRGLIVGHVEPGSAAAAAGLRVGDVITNVQDQPARDAMDVISAMASAGKGDQVTIDLVRDGHPMTLRATMQDAPMPMPAMGNMKDMRQLQQQLEHGMPDLPKMFEDMMHDMPWPNAWSWGMGWPQGSNTQRT